MELKGHLLYYPEGKHDINLNNYVQKSQLNDAIKSKVDSITKTTYADLKNLRDNSQLVPGNLYRITDYQCTTIQENTRSAGHQFDIVLLALSANKLAEEGWAMMNESNVYDVTFKDGVTKKCWLYEYEDYGELVCNIVDYETLLGTDGVVLNEEITIDKENKTATFLGFSYNLPTPDLPYNYFQNSNLSAWKVWYCLDNDKSRFAWADDSVDEGTPATMIIVGSKGEILTRKNPTDDMVVNNIQYYAWNKYGDTYNYYTLSQTPETGDDTFEYDVQNEIMVDFYPVKSYTPAHEGTGLPNGHGIIYRLIDEFNNDCPYDFKNILHIINVKFEDPVINYTFYNSESRDSSMNSAEIIVYNNYISPITETFENGSTLYIIPTITIGETSNNNRIYGKNIGLVNAKNVVLIGSSDLSLGSLLKGVGPTIYIGNTEIVGSNSSGSFISDEDTGGGSRAN